MDAIKRRVHEEGVSAISLMPKKVQELSAFISETFTPECVLGGEVPKNLVGSPPQLNEELSAALRTVRAHVANAISSLSAVRRWIVCQIPPVEDGGNFGVDIQLGVAKEIASEIEKLEKVFDSLPDYHEKRAGAWEKVMSKTSKESKKSSSKGDSTGGEKGDQHTTNQSESMEEKTLESVAPPDAWAYLLAVDARGWGQLHRGALLAMDCLIATSDLVEKNMSKLTNPRGNNGGGGSNFMF